MATCESKGQCSIYICYTTVVVFVHLTIDCDGSGAVCERHSFSFSIIEFHLGLLQFFDSLRRW